MHKWQSASSSSSSKRTLYMNWFANPYSDIFKVQNLLQNSINPDRNYWNSKFLANPINPYHNVNVICKKNNPY